MARPKGPRAFDLGRQFEALEALDQANPIPAWRAYFLARRFGVEVPTWVLEYLDGCAMRIQEMVVAAVEAGRARREGEEPEGLALEVSQTKDVPTIVFERLGFTRGSAFSDYARLLGDEAVAQFLALAEAVPSASGRKQTKTELKADVASRLAGDDEKVSVRTVERRAERGEASLSAKKKKGPST